MSNRFAINVDEMSSKVPMLPAGVYAASIIGATIDGKEGKQYINVVEEEVYDKKIKAMVPTGKYVLKGLMMFGVIIKSEKAKQILLQDEPRLYGGMIPLTFNQEDGTLALKNNVKFKQLLDVTGLDYKEFQESVDTSILDDVEIPEELQDVDNIDTLYQSAVYHRELFNMIANAINNMDVRVKVIVRQNRQDNSVKENAIDPGTFQQPSIGLLPYVPGCEEDLK